MSDEVTGKAKGGIARREALSPERRSEIARNAANAKWDESIPRATHAGILNLGGSELSCYVLADGTRILSTRAIMKSLNRTWRGRKYGGTELPVFLEAKNLKPFISKELTSVLSPLDFRTEIGARAEGFRAEILPAVCDIYLKARQEGALTPNQLVIAQQCEMLVRGLANTGIVALVDEATGFQAVRPKDALQSYLEMILRKELAAWGKKFPDEFYINIYKLKGWTWPGMQKNRFSVVAKYTRNLIYERLAPGVLTELEKRSPKDEKGNRKHKLHQWLNDDLGHPMLAQHMHAILMFQRLAIQNGQSWDQFLSMVQQVMPKKDSTLLLPLSLSDEKPIA
jgi:P63C domain